MLFRSEKLPVVIKVSSLPPHIPGSRVLLSVGRSDLLDVELELHFVETLAEPDAETLASVIAENG